MNRIYTLVASASLMAVTLTGCAQDPNAIGRSGYTVAAEKLFANLCDMPVKGIMFGHQDDPFYGYGWRGEQGRSDVLEVCGEYPAVIGGDLSKLERDSELNIDGVPFESERREYIAQYERGGMVTISWHCDNPLTGGDAWDHSDTTVVASILEGGALHEMFIGWLDKVAGFLNSLETADGVKVPVLFRPWHEHTAHHFWWGYGNCTREQFIALWVMTYDYIHERCPQVIFSYSPSFYVYNGTFNTEEYLRWFPGNKYVQVLGADLYRGATQSSQGYIKNCEQMLDVTVAAAKETGLPYALTETGHYDMPDPNYWTGDLLPVLKKYKPVYVLLWRNDDTMIHERYVPWPGHPAERDFLKFHDDKATLFLSDIAGKLYK
ncbi:MAG: beta-mannosidase [Bacteroidales bacterium]|nr:beta-mannosidase [Candidatus Cryptobacteroides aphodequi]